MRDIIWGMRGGWVGGGLLVVDCGVGEKDSGYMDDECGCSMMMRRDSLLWISPESRMGNAR